MTNHGFRPVGLLNAIGAFMLPFVVMTLVIAFSHTIAPINFYVGTGLSVLVGLPFASRAVGPDARWYPLLYVPVMFALMVIFFLVVQAVVFNQVI